MKTNKFSFFELDKFVSILTIFCLFSFEIQVFGQKINRKKTSASKSRPVEKQVPNGQPVIYWSETRKPGERRKLALLIGISDYSSQCKPILGKDNCWYNSEGKTDVEELEKVLREKFEFEVVKLTDSQATKNGIKQAFEKMISLTNNGDIVYVHFSGHGTTAPDQPAPKNDEADGMDEALVPFDYGYKDNINGLIIDDNVNVWLNSLKGRMPLSVTVTFDSCHSGTAIRGRLPRGSAWSGPINKQKRRGVEKSPSGLVENNTAPKAGFVYISAAAPDESAYPTETEPRMGEFTQALINTLKKARRNSTTYRDAFEKIKDIVARNQGSQNPQIEGDWDNLLMGNSALPTETYFTIETEGSNYMLQAGKLHGMRVGSKFVIYEAGTKKIGEEGRRKLTDAEIIRTYPLKSLLKLDKSFKPDNLLAARAFETSRQFDVEALQVVVNKLPNIEEVVKSYEFVQLREQGNNKSRSYDLLFRQRDEKIDKDLSAKNGDIVMERGNGSVKIFSSTSKDLRVEIKNALEQEVRWKGVKELENDNSDLQVEMRIVPVNIERNPDGTRSEDDFGTPKEFVFGTSGLELNLGEYFRVEVKNSSKVPVYITILSLSGGKIRADFPRTDNDKKDERNKINNDGQWKPISVSRIAPPIEIEGYKLIATEEKSDFSSLIDSSVPDGERTAGGLSGGEENAKRLPIGKLFSSLSSGTKSREPIEPVESKSWMTVTISYRITCPVVNGVEKCCKDETKMPWQPVACKNENSRR